MISVVLLATFLSLSGAVFPSTEQQAELVVSLNEIRSGVVPPAAAMYKVEYNLELQTVANWSISKCHYPGIFYKGNQTYNESIGMNLAVFPQENMPEFQEALAYWGEGKMSYNYTTNNCTNNSVCWPYVQMIWNETKTFGCAMQHCNSFYPVNGSSFWLVGCAFSPRVNMTEKKPYEAGENCSHCPPGTTCENGLCVITPIITTTTSATTTNTSYNVIKANEKEQGFIIELLNLVRSQVDPSAANMIETEYSDQTAQVAADTVAYCNESIHPSDSYGIIYERVREGEVHYSDLLPYWALANENYTYETNTCKTPNGCDKYKQMIWHDDKTVGCAYATCENSSNGSQKTVEYLVGCAFNSRANLSDKPYKSGSWASECPPETTPGTKLCQQIKPTTTTTAATTIKPTTAFYPSDDYVKVIVRMLNHNRKNVNPSAATMIETLYSREIEKYAGDLVKWCNVNVEIPETANYSALINFRYDVAESYSELFEHAFSGRNYYNYFDNICNSQDKTVCDRYKKLVWYDNRYVGCAFAICERSPDYFPSKILQSCVFVTKANLTERPYPQGPWGYVCPPGYVPGPGEHSLCMKL